MSSVTFFGHWIINQNIYNDVKSVVIDLIENQKATTFYVGTHGGFDDMAQKVLAELSLVYPSIKYYIVFAYYDTKHKYFESDEECIKHTIFPEGLEKVPRRFAIIERNRWMIKQSDIVVTYVKHIESGAAIAKEIAEKEKKKAINIPEITNFSTN